MVSAPARPAAIAEKYINIRTQNFTRTHARAMQQWLNDGRGSEEDYYKQFRADVERSTKKWEADTAAIDRDPHMSFREKREEKNKLHRMAPSWDLLQEERFIQQWGDPRLKDRGRLETLLIDLESPSWENALRQGEMRVIEKKPWERKFYEAIINPQDGSVPLYMDAADIRVSDTPPTYSGVPAAMVAPDERVLGMPAIPQVEVPEIDPEANTGGAFLTEQQKARVKNHLLTLAKRTCPYCLATFEKGLKPQHVGSAGCKAAQEALK